MFEIEDLLFIQNLEPAWDRAPTASGGARDGLRYSNIALSPDTAWAGENPAKV